MGSKLTDSLLWCDANRRIVILDLQNQRYRGLPGDLESTFRAIAAGEHVPSAQYERLRAILPESPLNADLPRLRPTGALPSPRTDTIQTTDRAVAGLDTAIAIVEQLKCAMILRTLPFSQTIMTLASRQRPASGTDGTDMRHEAAISAFLRARRILKSNDRCLMHSIAMSNYLAGRGYFTTVVIGVKTAPWGAHAWVQDHDRVLNDSVDHVAAYTPILAV